MPIQVGYDPNALGALPAIAAFIPPTPPPQMSPDRRFAAELAARQYFQGQQQQFSLYSDLMQNQMRSQNQLDLANLQSARDRQLFEQGAQRDEAQWGHQAAMQQANLEAIAARQREAEAQQFENQKQLIIAHGDDNDRRKAKKLDDAITALSTPDATGSFRLNGKAYDAQQAEQIKDQLIREYHGIKPNDYSKPPDMPIDEWTKKTVTWTDPKTGQPMQGVPPGMAATMDRNGTARLTKIEDPQHDARVQEYKLALDSAKAVLTQHSNLHKERANLAAKFAAMTKTIQVQTGTDVDGTPIYGTDKQALYTPEQAHQMAIEALPDDLGAAPPPPQPAQPQQQGGAMSVPPQAGAPQFPGMDTPPQIDPNAGMPQGPQPPMDGEGVSGGGAMNIPPQRPSANELLASIPAGFRPQKKEPTLPQVQEPDPDRYMSPSDKARWQVEKKRERDAQAAPLVAAAQQQYEDELLIRSAAFASSSAVREKAAYAERYKGKPDGARAKQDVDNYIKTFSDPLPYPDPASADAKFRRQLKEAMDAGDMAKVAKLDRQGPPKEPDLAGQVKNFHVYGPYKRPNGDWVYGYWDAQKKQMIPVRQAEPLPGV